MHALTPRRALREFQLGYTHARAGALEAASIGAELFLNAGWQYPFACSQLARVFFEPGCSVRVQSPYFSTFLATLASSTNPGKSQALASFLELDA